MRMMRKTTTTKQKQKKKMEEVGMTEGLAVFQEKKSQWKMKESEKAQFEEKQKETHLAMTQKGELKVDELK